MGKDNIGSLIRTATKNITGGQSLTDSEKAIVSQLSLPMKETKRNWHPIFVRETGLHQFQLIGSSLILEAAKLAELEVVHCIQINELDKTEKEIAAAQQLMQSTTEGRPSSAIDLSPLIKRLDGIESTVSQHSTSLDKLDNVLEYLRRLMPDEQLAINKDSEKLLRGKLEGRISQVGKKKIDQFIDDIITNRPFYNDEDLRYGVKILKPNNSKSPFPVYEKAWESLVKQFEIDYSI